MAVVVALVAAVAAALITIIVITRVDFLIRITTAIRIVILI